MSTPILSTSSGDGRLNPFLLVTIVIMLGGALVAMNRISTAFAPLVFAAACVGMVAIALIRRREEKKARLEIDVVDHAQLAQKDLTKYLPWLKENVRGQDAVIEEVVAYIQQNLSLARRGRTLGAFLLVGPTGTGKTFLAQLIAQALYPESEPLLLRMNQCKHADDVFTLIGPPPGSPGYEVGGTLTRPVLENPRRVVILDEIDKCHQDLQHCLYDILDSATCREKSSGRMVDFSGSVFFATSNAGVEGLRALHRETITHAVWLGRARDVLVREGGFDKAFLARWSGIFLMDELPSVHIAEVACMELARQWGQYGITLEYTAPELLLEAVARNEDFRQYGVRQLGAYLQARMSPAIREVRQRGSKNVKLDVDEHGEIVVRDVP